MNDSRKKRLETASAHITDAIALIEEVKEEEQEAFDNLSETMQESEKGEAMETTIATLDDAVSALEEADGHISEAQT